MVHVLATRGAVHVPRAACCLSHATAWHHLASLASRGPALSTLAARLKAQTTLTACCLLPAACLLLAQHAVAHRRMPSRCGARSLLRFFEQLRLGEDHAPCGRLQHARDEHVKRTTDELPSAFHDDHRTIV